MEKHICKIRRVVVDERPNSCAWREIDWDGLSCHSDKRRLCFHWNVRFVGVQALFDWRQTRLPQIFQLNVELFSQWDDYVYRNHVTHGMLEERNNHFDNKF